MTKITVQNGRPRVISGKVSVNQQDCCCDLEMPTTLTLTLSETPEVYFRRSAAIDMPFPAQGITFWPSSAGVLAKCGRSFTPMLDIRTAPHNMVETVYERTLNDFTDFVPGGMPLQDGTITLELVEQVTGQWYFYEGWAIRPPTNLTGPPPGQGLNDNCIDCGGVDAYFYTPVAAGAGATSISVVEPIKVGTPVPGVIRIKGVRHRYGHADVGGNTFSNLTPPLTESVSGSDVVAVPTELVTVTIQKKCVSVVPASVCISDPTKGDASARSRASATVTATDGVIDSIALTSGGSGYASADTYFAMPKGDVQIFDQSGMGSGAKFSLTFQEVTPGGPDWFLASVSVTDQGSGYSGVVAATFVPLEGTYALYNSPLPSLSAIVNNGKIDSVAVDFGSLLRREVATSIETDTPTVTFCSMKGDGAAATVVVDKTFNSPTFGQITKLNLTSGGEGYNDTLLIVSEPTITLAPQSGVGGVLNVDGYFPRAGNDAGYYGISGVSVAHGGSGYVDKSAVSITLGDGDVQRPASATPDIRIRTIRRPLDQWTLVDKSSPNPSSGSGMVVSLTLVPFAVGDTRWKASGASLVGLGSGYASGETFDVSATEGGTISPARVAVTAVGVGGEVSEISLTSDGVFQGFDTGKIDRVEFFGDNGWQGSYRNELIERKTVDLWSCTVAFPWGVSKSFSFGYEHASRLRDLSNGYDCCAAVEECRHDDYQRIAPCPKPLLSRAYDMVLPFAGSFAQIDGVTGGLKDNFSAYHCGSSSGFGGIQNCDLGTISGCKEETLQGFGYSTPPTVVYTPLTGIKCNLTPGPAADCDTAWLEPLCDGSCPGDSTLMASLVSLKIESDCGVGATGTVTIGCTTESGVVTTNGVILSAAVTNTGTGYAKTIFAEPTLTLTPTGGTGGELTIKSYTKSGDYWAIGEVEVTKAGNGYTNNAPVTISLGAGDEGFPNQPTPDIRIRTKADPPADEWVIFAQSITGFPSGGTGLVLSITLERALWWDGSEPMFEATSVTILDGGTGYGLNDYVYADTTTGSAGPALQATSVDQDGTITGLAILSGLVEGTDLGVIDSVVFGTIDGIVWRGAYRKQTAQVCNVTVSLEQQPPSDGYGAIINAVVQTDPSKAGFGTITGLTVVSGGSGYVARCCGNPLP